MNKWLQKGSQFVLSTSGFNQRRIAIVCVGIAIIAKSLISWLYTSLEGDKALYLLMAKGFLETGRFTEPVSIFETGITTHLFNPAISSPLYSLMVTPLLWLTNSYFITQLILSCLSWFLFFTGLYKVTQVVFKNYWQVSFFLLFTGLFLYPHEMGSAPKDTWAIGFCIWSIYFLNTLMANRQLIKSSLLLSVSLALLFLIKLIYIPVVAVLFFVFLITTIKTRSRRILFGFSLGLVVFFTILLAAYFFIYESAQIKQPLFKGSLISDGTTFKRGFFPSNLLYSSPYIVAALFNTEVWAMLAEKIFHFSFLSVMKAFTVGNWILMAGLLIFLIKKYKALINKATPFLFVMVSICLVVTVYWLSLTQEAFTYVSSNRPWTYVMDARSFLIPMLSIQFFVFYLAFQPRTNFLIKAVLIFFIASETLHGFYFVIKQTNEASAVRFAKNRNTPNKRIVALLQKQPDKTETNLVTPDWGLRRLAMLHGITTYAITTAPMEKDWTNSSKHFVVAIYSFDSVSRTKLHLNESLAFDSIPPYVLYYLPKKSIGTNGY